MHNDAPFPDIFPDVFQVDKMGFMRGEKAVWFKDPPEFAKII